MKPLTASILATIVLSLGACGGEDVADPQSSDSPEDGIRRTTIVELHPDGTETISYPEEQATSAKSAHATARAVCPDFNALELHDEPASWGQLTGRRICFVGSGTVDLRRYCRGWNLVGGFPICVGYWNGHVGSYWTGRTSGWLSQNASNPADSCQSFSQQVTFTTTGWCGSHAVWATIR